jgi:hypothetical protein
VNLFADVELRYVSPTGWEANDLHETQFMK